MSFFVFESVPNQYKTQEICDEAVDDYLVALKIISDWFVTSKMLENFCDALLINDNILFFDEDFSKVKFLANKMGILGVDPVNINLDDDVNIYEDDPETFNHVRPLVTKLNLKNTKHLKKI